MGRRMAELVLSEAQRTELKLRSSDDILKSIGLFYLYNQPLRA